MYICDILYVFTWKKSNDQFQELNGEYKEIDTNKYKFGTIGAVSSPDDRYFLNCGTTQSAFDTAPMWFISESADCSNPPVVFLFHESGFFYDDTEHLGIDFILYYRIK